jgi:hypothetical protein
MADQHDKRDSEGSFPIGGGGIKDVKKLNIKMSFRSLSSSRKVDKGRLQTQFYASGVATSCQHMHFRLVDGTVSATAVIKGGKTTVQVCKPVCPSAPNISAMKWCWSGE